MKNLTLFFVVVVCLTGCGRNGASNSVLKKAIAAEYERDTGDKVSEVHIEKTFGNYPSTLRSPQDTGMTSKVRARITDARLNRTFRYAYEVFVASSDGYVIAQHVPDQELADECVKNLRMIDGAIQQWALENRKPLEARAKEEDIAPYFKDHRFPQCPAGGTYILQRVADSPFCLNGGPGHTLSSY